MTLIGFDLTIDGDPRDVEAIYEAASKAIALVLNRNAREGIEEVRSGIPERTVALVRPLSSIHGHVRLRRA